MTKSCASFFLRKKAAQDNKVKIKCLGRAYHDPTMRRTEKGYDEKKIMQVL
jgi:hypothetical protein